MTPRTARVLLAAAAALAVALASAALFPEFVYHQDEIQLAQGLARFDLRHHQPHPPGSYGLLLLGRLLRPAVGRPEDALRWVAALAAAAFAALVAARVPREGLGRTAAAGLAAAAAAWVLASPVVLFLAVSCLAYTAEAAAWVALLVILGERPRGARLWLVGAGAGLAGGLRPTLIVWGGLVLVGQALRHRDWLDARGALRLAGGFAAGLLAWAVPMLVEAGGLAEYLRLCRPLMTGNVLAGSVFSAGPGAVAARLPVMLRDLWAALGPLALVAAALLVLRAAGRRRSPLAGLDALPLGALLAFVFYAVLIYDNRGYILSCAMPLAAWVVLALARLATGVAAARQLLLAAAALVPVLALAALPGGDSGHELLVRHDAELRARFQAVRAGFDPRDTLLVTSHEYWAFGLRHVMYYLPEYTVLQLVPDPFLVDTTPERPYLAARDGAVFFAGPDGLELRRLGPGAGFTRALYLNAHDVERFVLASCAPWMLPLRVPPAELLPIVPLDAGPAVRVVRGRIDCRP